MLTTLLLTVVNTQQDLQAINMHLQSFVVLCYSSKDGILLNLLKHLVSLRVSSWENVVLKTPFVAGTTTEAVLGTLPVVYMSVCLWTMWTMNECAKMGVVR